MQRFKKIAVPILEYLLIMGLAVAIRQLLFVKLDEAFTSLFYKASLLILFAAVFLKSKTHRQTFFQIKAKLNAKDYALVLFLGLLFLANNLYFKSSNSFNYGEFGSTYFMLSFLSISIASIGEEFAYRGFLQTKINQAFKLKTCSFLSPGNVLASVIMLISHFGFFSIMSIDQAIPSLILVLVFSLIAGYFKDKYQSLMLPIGIHLLMNYIHVAISMN